MNLALLTVQFGRLGPLNYSNICDRRVRSGERCRFLLDFTDGRAYDSRDVSLLVSLFIVPPGHRRAAATSVPKVRQVRRVGRVIGIPRQFLEFQPQFSQSAFECLGDSLS